MSKPLPAVSVKKNALIATAAIFGSRVFGLVREQIFAVFFGASFALDAFIAAFRIPNLLRDLFAEGALSQSFVAIFSQKLAKGDQESAYRLANRVATFLVLFLGSLVILGIIFSPQIVSLIANGFTGEKFELTVTLNRILFPFIIFVALAAILMGMLNAMGRFFLPQSASTFFNITSIITGIGTAWWLAPEYVSGIFSRFTGATPAVSDPEGLKRAIIGMAVGSLLGGIVQWAIQLPALYRLGYRQRVDLDFKDPDFRRVLGLTLPAIIGGAGVQINVVINTYFASYLHDGSISYLNYAFRFMQFPLGLFGVAVATASAPVLAGMISQNRHDDFRRTMRSSLQMSLFFGIPSTIGLVILANPIVSLIYQHGRFTAMDSIQTSLALMAYSLGICGYSLIKIYQPAFLAFHDSKTPMYVSLASIALNLGINWTFLRVLNLPHWGLALGTACVATLNLIFLVLLFRGKLKGVWSQGAVVYVGKILAASLLMGAATWGIHDWLRIVFNDHSLFSRALLVFLPMSVAALTYALSCVLFRVDEAKLLMKKIRR